MQKNLMKSNCRILSTRAALILITFILSMLLITACGSAPEPIEEMSPETMSTSDFAEDARQTNDEEPEYTSKEAQPSIPMTGFRPVSFGMTFDEVLEAETELEMKDNKYPERLFYEGFIKGIYCLVIYNFNDNGNLFSVDFGAFDNRASVRETVDDYNTFLTAIIEEYGKPFFGEEYVEYTGEISTQLNIWYPDGMEITLALIDGTRIMAIFKSEQYKPETESQTVPELQTHVLAEIPFGSNQEYVKAAIDGASPPFELLAGDENILVYDTYIFGMKKLIVFLFTDAGEFSDMRLYHFYLQDSETFDDDIEKSIENFFHVLHSLAAIYGPQSDVGWTWPNQNMDEYGDDEHIQAIINGDVRFWAFWKYDEYEILLVLENRHIDELVAARGCRMLQAMRLAGMDGDVIISQVWVESTKYR